MFLVICCIYNCVYTSVPIFQCILLPPFPLNAISLFSTSVTLFLFCKEVHLYLFFFLDYTYKQYMIFVFFCLTLFTWYANSSLFWRNWEVQDHDERNSLFTETASSFTEIIFSVCCHGEEKWLEGSLGFPL